MNSAGDLRFRLRFEARAPVNDGYGNTKGAWSEQFTVSAAIQPLKGGEGVTAGRLQGQQPVVIQVRRSSRTVQITAGWRAIDARNGTEYALTSPPADMTGKGQFLDMLATVGAGS